MKKIVVFIFICLASQSLISQTIKDRVFNDVILVDTTNSAGSSDFILDFPIEATSGKPVVIFNENLNLPNKLFFKPEFLRHFLLKSSSFQLITSDRVLKMKQAISLGEKGCSKPMGPSYYLYQVTLINKRLVIDSLYIDPNDNNQPIIHWKKKDVDTKNKFLVYYTDAWGSICCPKDPKYGSRETILYQRKLQLANFSFKNAKTYVSKSGEEGEHSTYFTLNNFTLSDKLAFILAMKNSSIVNRELKDIAHIPQIYFPYYVDNVNLKEVDYNISHL